MQLKPIIAATALALMVSSAGFAADTDMKKDYNAKPADSGYTKPEADDSKMEKDVKKGLNEAGQEMRETADDIRATIIGGKGSHSQQVTFHAEVTAKGMLGKKIATPAGDSIAKVEDILLDKDGNATKVIVSDGGLLGIGDKLASFDYGRVITKTADDRVKMDISQDMIDRAKDFSYDPKDTGKVATTVLPADAVSVKQLMGGNVYDNSDKKVASIDNLSIIDGKADRLIVGFNKVLGMGGDLAALDYGVLTLKKDGNDVDAKMDAATSRQFADFRKTASK